MPVGGPPQIPEGSDGLLVRVLGHVELTAAGEPIALTPSERTLVAGLALARGRVASVESLTDWMWGEARHASPRNRLQAIVSSLRRKVPGSLVVTHALGYSLDGGADTDIAQRERLLTGLARKDATVGERRTIVRRAVDLTTGDPLTGCRETEAVLASRHRLAEDSLELLVERFEADLEARQFEGVVPELVEITADHPLQEAFQAQLVRALAHTGRQAEALRRYRMVYEMLDEELGVRPGPALSAAHQEVLRMEEVAQPPPRGVGETTPSAPAPHRDVERTSRPVPRSAPRAVHRLVGREAEREAIRRAAGEATAGPGASPAQVVAITGAGGVGKSALAVDAAHGLRDHFPDGTLYLSMSSETGRRGTSSVLGLFLGMLGVVGAAVPDDRDARVALFRSVLDELQVLIVLEDVGDPADVIDLLPPTASSMAILTSRGSLAACEPTVTLPLAELAREEAVELLSGIIGERAPAGAGLAELAAQCLDLPLLLCVTGRRVAAQPDLTVAAATSALATERAQQPGRDTGREAVFAGLGLAEARLGPRARTVLSWLAALPLDEVSTWFIESLADEQGSDLDGEIIEGSTVAELCDAGLLEPVVRPGCSSQVRLHDLVRGHARAHGGPMTGPDDAALRRAARVLARLAGRHARHYPAGLLPLPPGLVPDSGGESGAREALIFFRTEYDTLLTLTRGVVDLDPELAWRLLVLAGNHVARGPRRERWAEVAEAVRRRLGHAPGAERGRIHIDLASALVLHETSRSKQAAAMAHRVHRLLVADEDVGAAVPAAVVIARAERANGNRAMAESALRWASANVSDWSDPVMRGYIALARGSLLDDYDDLVGAHEYLREASALLEGTRDWWALGTSECALARVSRRLGRHDEGLAAVQRAEDIAIWLDDAQGRVAAMDCRADLLVHMRRYDEALPVAREAVEEAHRQRDVFVLHRSQRTLGRALAGLGRTDEARVLLLESAAGFERTERPLSRAATLRDLGRLLADDGRTTEALGVVDEEQALLTRAGVTVDPDLVDRRRRLLGALSH